MRFVCFIFINQRSHSCDSQGTQRHQSLWADYLMSNSALIVTEFSQACQQIALDLDAWRENRMVAQCTEEQVQSVTQKIRENMDKAYTLLEKLRIADAQLALQFEQKLQNISQEIHDLSQIQTEEYEHENLLVNIGEQFLESRSESRQMQRASNRWLIGGVALICAVFCCFIVFLIVQPFLVRLFMR